MPASNDTSRREALACLETRFGVATSAFAALTFFEPTDGEIWVATPSFLPELRSRRAPGLRAFRRTPVGLKPTSGFLVAIGPLVTASRVSVDRETLTQLLLGRRVPCDEPSGYIALAFDGYVVGCGLVADGNVHCLIPTARRRDLLGILGVSETLPGADL